MDAFKRRRRVRALPAMDLPLVKKSDGFDDGNQEETVSQAPKALFLLEV